MILDQQKIGRYIAEKRKGLGLTQKQLAQKLDMSDKSVSKWERGVCLPDASKYSELCEILGIRISEFFAGADIPTEAVAEQSEKSLIRAAEDERRYRRKITHLTAGMIASVSVFALLILSACFYLYCSNHPVIALQRGHAKPDGSLEYFFCVEAERLGIPMSWKAKAESRAFAMWNKSVFDGLYTGYPECRITVSGKTDDGKTTLRYTGTVTDENGNELPFEEENTFEIKMDLTGLNQ